MPSFVLLNQNTTETKDIDKDFMREYDNMCKSMEYKQIHDSYEARRYIQSAMEGDTPIKTSQNRQCIDNVRDYNREYDRILNSVRHTLDLVIFERRKCVIIYR